MAKRLSMALLLPTLMVAAAALLQISNAQTAHVVGGSLISGWQIPTSNPSAYSTWASNETFTVGDTLVFNFTTGAHDVAQVTKAAYDACTTTNPIFSMTTGPATVKLNSTGPHYYICTVPGHCSAGQKLAINVTASSSASPAPTPSASAPSPSTSAPSPSTSAPSPSTSPAPGSSATPPSTTTSPPPPTTTSSSPAGSATPPSPGNSATSLGAAGFSATILSIAVALFY